MTSRLASSFPRRDFVKMALTGSVLPAMSAASATSREGTLIDVNINLGAWPTRRLQDDEPATLAAMLRERGVIQAWAGSFDGLLHKDIASVNGRLTAACRKEGRDFFLPFGSINPLAVNWEEDLRRCVEQHRMPGIRLHPNYHGYRLDHAELGRLLGLAAERDLIVQLAIVMEDERMMHPHLRVEPVDTAPLVAWLEKIPKLRLVLLNALRTVRAKPLLDLVAAGEVHLEISMLEGVAGIANLLDQIPDNRLLFGSHAPLFYFEAALLKLKESPLSTKQLNAIQRQNASRLLPKNR